MSQDTLTQDPALEAKFNQLFSDGQYKEAARIGLQCKLQYRKAGREQTLEFAALLENLAACYRELKDYDEAAVLLQKAIEIRSSLAGPADPLAVRDLFALAALYELKGDPAAARATYHRAVFIQRKASRVISPVIPPLVEIPAPRKHPSPAAPSASPVPASETTVPQGQPAAELTRYGRVEYYSPMEVRREYPLRVGILLEQHGEGVPERARVSWARLRFEPIETEPILLIIPVATWLEISPFQRNLKVKEKADVFADFKMIAPRMPPGEQGTLDIEIEYAGSRVQQLSVVIRIQDQIKIGPIRLPRSILTVSSLVVGALFTLPSVLSVIDTIRDIGSSITPPLLGATLLLALILIAAGVWMLRHGPRRLAQSF